MNVTFSQNFHQHLHRQKKKLFYLFKGPHHQIQEPVLQFGELPSIIAVF